MRDAEGSTYVADDTNCFADGTDLKASAPQGTQAEVRFWKEKAESAERRAKFAELRLRAVEVQLNTLTQFLDEERRSWRANVKKLARSIPPYCHAAFNVIVGKTARSFKRTREEPGK